MGSIFRGPLTGVTIGYYPNTSSCVFPLTGVPVLHSGLATQATINPGTDLETGTTAWNRSMVAAVPKGLVTDATVTTAASRGLLQRFVQGDFDPVAAPAPPPPRSMRRFET